jgi:hypothetical protein
VKQGNRFSGRRLGTLAAMTSATVVAGLTLAPAAFANSDVAQRAAEKQSGQVTIVQDQARPDNASDCLTYLEMIGYPKTVGRATACLAGSLPSSNAFAACYSGLLASGVGFLDAVPACVLAAH